MGKTKMEKTKLEIIPSGYLTLTEAMEKIPGGSVTEFLLAYSPTHCGFANWNNSTLEWLDGTEASDFYEVRAFGKKFELRWVKDASDDKGRTTILQDTDADDASGKEYYFLPGEYLLWGKAGKDAANNSSKTNGVTLHEPRVGSLRIPVPSDSQNLAEGARVSLLFKEYFEPDEKYGNFVFVAERLVGLRTIKPPHS
jgi:CRISPR-associated protein (TIGR03984 family)